MGVERTNSVNSRVAVSSNGSHVSTQGSLAGRQTIAIDQNSKGFSTLSKVLMCTAGVAVLATGAAYAMGYFSRGEAQLPVHIPTVDPTKIIDLFPVPFAQYTKTSANAYQPSVLNNPELLFKDREYRAISTSEMNQYFGQGSTLLPDDQRTFYNRYAEALKKYALNAIENVTDSSFRTDVSMMACKNRENAAEYTRENGYQVFEWAAMLKDRVVHGTWDRPSCEYLAKRYEHNPKTFIEKAGSPNSGVNFFADLVSPSLRFFSSQNQILQAGITGMENTILAVDDLVRKKSLLDFMKTVPLELMKVNFAAGITTAAVTVTG